MVQLVKPEVHGSNPAVNKFYLLYTKYALNTKIKTKRPGMAILYKNVSIVFNCSTLKIAGIRATKSKGQTLV